MTTNEQFEPIFPTHIDNTMLTLYKACRYKFFTQQVRGIQSPAVSIHLHFGGIFAKACEITRKAFYANGLIPEEAISLGEEHILKNFGDWDEEEVEVKNLNNCLWAFSEYFRSAYPLGFDRFVPFRESPEGAPQIEFSFAIPIPVDHPVTGDPLMYTGRCDAIVADVYTFDNIWEARELWTQDEKTTKQMGAQWAKQWRLRGQFIGYTWAARQYGLPTVGTLVRGICVYKRNPPKFEQAFIKLNRSVVERWYDQMILTAREMVCDWHANYWKQDFGDTCAEYGGCGFISMCELEDPEPFFKVKFVERRWDPLKREEVEGGQ